MFEESVINQAQQHAFAIGILSAVSAQLGAQAPPVSLSGDKVRIREITHNGSIFRLKELIQASWFCKEGLYYCEYKPLSLLSFGMSLSGAVESFLEDFAMVWDVIGQAPDSSLAPGAKKVKRHIRSLVKSVVSE